MKLFLGIRQSVFFLSISTFSLYAESPQSNRNIVEDCDIPVGTIESQPTTSQDQCQSTCAANSKCNGFVFVSGWNRCMLKSGTRMRKGIVMHGGRIDIRKDELPNVESFGAGTDHTGRDLRRVSPVASEKQCQEQCINEKLCKGYVWIGGYSDCWLKKTAGKSLSKRFYCGVVDREKDLISH